MNSTNIPKKIGIITLHQSTNYGAVVQAFALEYFLQKSGYDTEIIDYVEFDKETRSQSLFQKLRHNLWHSVIYPLLAGKKRFTRTQNWIEEKVKLSPKHYERREELAEDPPQYDVYITGSDQVWNPYNTNDDASYFLAFAPSTAKRLSYAASFGLEQIPEKFHSEYQTRLRYYDRISVREERAQQLVKELSGVDAELVLDPTFLPTSEDWKKLATPPPTGEKYILCYYMLNKEINREEMKIARAISKKTGWKILHLGLREYRKFLFWENHVTDAGVSEFLGLVQNASFVVTNSFHGCAFSVIFRRPFLAVTSVKHPLKSRIETLLNVFHLQDRIHYIENPDLDITKHLELDYTDKEKFIDQAQSHSRSFLLDQIAK